MEDGGWKPTLALVCILHGRAVEALSPNVFFCSDEDLSENVNRRPRDPLILHDRPARSDVAHGR
jgi:hypothetical protein